MPRAKKVTPIVEVAPVKTRKAKTTTTVAPTESTLKTFKVRRVVEYIVEAKNEYHAENKAAKLATNSDYAAETPVSELSISTVIVEKLS